MKLEFPADFRASLLLHDGQERKPADDDSETSTLFEWMPGNGALAPLSAITAQRKDEAMDAGDWAFDAKKGNARAKNEKPDDFPHEGEEFAAYVKKHASGPKAAAPKKKATRK